MIALRTRPDALYHTGNKKVSGKNKRWYKDVGLGFKTPTEAINGSYIGASRTSLCRLTLINDSNRQEVPLHRSCLDSWSYLDRQGRFHQNDADYHHPSRLPPLHPQIQCVPSFSRCTSLLNIQTQTVTRRGTRTSPPTCPRPSVSRLAMW